MRFSTVVVFAFVVVLSVVSGAFSDRASRYSTRGAYQQDAAAAAAAAQAQQGRSLEAKAAGFQHESPQEHIAASAAGQQARAAAGRAAGQGQGASAAGNLGIANQAARARGLNMGGNHEVTEAFKMLARGVTKMAREMMGEPAE